MNKVWLLLIPAIFLMTGCYEELGWYEGWIAPPVTGVWVGTIDPDTRVELHIAQVGNFVSGTAYVYRPSLMHTYVKESYPIDGYFNGCDLCFSYADVGLLTVRTVRVTSTYLPPGRLVGFWGGRRWRAVRER